jgi:hypothetical protein
MRLLEVRAHLAAQHRTQLQRGDLLLHLVDALQRPLGAQEGQEGQPVRLLRQLHGATGLFASQFALANRFVHRIGRQLIRLASYRQALRRLFASQIRLGVRKHGSRLSVYRQLLRPLRGLASLLHGLLGRFSRFKSIAALDFRDGQRPLGQLARFVGQRPRLLRRQRAR